MITIVSERRNGSFQAPTVTRQVSVGLAFTSLVKYELGFGGKVTSIDRGGLSLRTLVMACVDDTRFTGPEEEMAVLNRAAATFVQIKNEPSVKDALVDRVMETTQGVPLLVAHGHGLIMGQPVARAVAALAVAKNPSDFKALTALKENDLFALVELVLDGSPLEEALKVL